MNKFKIAILSVLSFILLSQTAFAEIMLFVGDGCPHCAVVEEYMEENGIADILDIEVYEVYYVEENRALFQEKAAEVGYQGGGVPFMAYGDKYEVGDKNIIAYLEKAAEEAGTPPSLSDLGAASVVGAEELDTESVELTAEPVDEGMVLATEEPVTEESDATTEDDNQRTIIIIVGSIIGVLLLGFVFFKAK